MSQRKNNLEQIRNYFLNCPVFDKHSILHIDYLNERIDETIEYSIMSEINSNMIVKRYTDGSTLRQFLFQSCQKKTFHQKSSHRLQHHHCMKTCKTG